MKILAIETSCDETAVAVVETDLKSGDFKILSNVVSSQVKIHAKWGGVVPNLAAREHLKNIIPVLDKALKLVRVKLSKIDLFAVTQGPGLIPALLLGTNATKSLAYFCDKPLIGLHHIEGHIYANYIEKEKDKYFGNLNKFKFPLLCLVISGGHTQLVLMRNHFDYKIIGQTQDDAVGEAYDKVAKILDLGYPGGPAVSMLASKQNNQYPTCLPDGQVSNIQTNYKLQTIIKSQNPSLKNIQKNGKKIATIFFPRPMLKSKNLDFSFSGLKTAVLYFWRDLQKLVKNKGALELWKSSICWEFENAVSEVLCQKSQRAIEKYQPKTFLLAGGVAANKRLRSDLEKIAKDSKIIFHCPLVEFCGDNAAMMGVAAGARIKTHLQGVQKHTLKVCKKVPKNNWRDLEAKAQMELK